MSDKYSQPISYSEAGEFLKRGWGITKTFVENEKLLECYLFNLEFPERKFSVEEALKLEAVLGIVCFDCRKFCHQQCQLNDKVKE